MELIRKPIHYTQAGKEIFHQFYLDEDYNVPEQKEDVQRIICGSAQLKTGDIRPVENGIRVTGAYPFPDPLYGVGARACPGSAGRAGSL